MDNHTFKISLPRVDGATEALIKEYIIEAIKSHSGGYDASHPLFGAFHDETVTCVRHAKPKPTKS